MRTKALERGRTEREGGEREREGSDRQKEKEKEGVTESTLEEWVSG